MGFSKMLRIRSKVDFGADAARCVMSQCIKYASRVITRERRSWARGVEDARD